MDKDRIETRRFIYLNKVGTTVSLVIKVFYLKRIRTRISGFKPLDYQAATVAQGP